jgi:hypothetical protein
MKGILGWGEGEDFILLRIQQWDSNSYLLERMNLIIFTCCFRTNASHTPEFAKYNIAQFAMFHLNQK